MPLLFNTAVGAVPKIQLYSDAKPGLLLRVTRPGRVELHRLKGAGAERLAEAAQAIEVAAEELPPELAELLLRECETSIFERSATRLSPPAVELLLPAS